MPLKLGDRLLGRSREVKKRDPRLKVGQLYRYYSLIEEILEHLCPEINDPAKFALDQREMAAYERFKLLVMRL